MYQFCENVLISGYGIAMRQGSQYRNLISGAVLKLQEDGRLHVLKTRWWKEKCGGGACNVVKFKKTLHRHLINICKRFFKDDTSKASSTANELGLANVGGVFVVLMGGMGIACVIAVCEFVWKSRKVAIEEKVINFTLLVTGFHNFSTFLFFILGI